MANKTLKKLKYNNSEVQVESAVRDGDGNVISSTYAPLASLSTVGSSIGMGYLTTAPTAANTDGGLKIVVLSSEPSTKYAGYIYLITEA